MTDPLDTWKSKEEDAIIAKSEERESTWPGVCPKCHYATDHCRCGSVEPTALPSVAGRMEMTHADFQRACQVAIQDYQDEPTNTYLVALFCEAVRCSRECCEIATIRPDAQRITTLLAVIEQCEKALRSIVGDRTKEHFKGNGPGAIAGEFDVKDLHMALDAIAAIKQVKEGK